MSEKRRFHLGQLTALSMAPSALIPMAADAGYDAVGIRLAPSTPGGTFYTLPPGSAALREVRQIIAATGTTVHEIECILIDEAFDVQGLSSIIEAAGELGARSLLITCIDGDHSRVVDSLCSLCEVIAPYRLTADLEFVPTRGVANARDALKIVRATGMANAGILIDAIHVARTDSPLEDIGAIPHAMINYWQICDAPAEMPATPEGILYAGRNERLLPGEGALDLVGLASLMPQAAAVSVEIPTITRAHVDKKDWVRIALDRSKALLARLDADAEARIPSDCGRS